MTSKFIQITPYCLLEYIYTSPIAPEDYSYNFYKIVNGKMNYVHLMNVDSADLVTRNVRERSAVQVSGGIYYETDKDQVPDYLSYDTDMTVTTITANNCPYDTMKFHFLAGYNFDDLDGVMLQAQAQERSGKQLMLCNLAFLKDSDYFEYNPRPVLLGDRLYDKYVQIKIPSIKLNNDIYYSLEGNPSQVNSFVAKVTSNGMGFLRGAPLTISVTEIKSTENTTVGSAIYNKFNIGVRAQVSINQSDEYALLGATMQPSPGGDYFEYFATWGGGFIEDYITNASGLPGYDYIVLHEIRVLEQVGSLYTQTAFFQSIQEGDYDKPNLFRPIVINADKAVSFTLEYTMRLYNKADSSQIIRTATYTDYNPKMWGKSMTKIQLLNEPEPYRIYNKVVAGPQLPDTTFINNASSVTVQQAQKQEIITKVVPAFFDKSLVTIKQDTMYLDSDGQLKTSATETTQPVYGQGDATIVVSPFDNYFKFTILRTESTNGNTPVPLDLGLNADYYITFFNNQNQKVSFRYMTDAKIGDPAAGDLVFKIPAADASNLVKFTNRQFWIVSKFADNGAETDIYHGEFVTVNEMDTLRDRQKAAAERSAQNTALEARIIELENQLNAANQKIADITAAQTNSATQTPTAIDAGSTGNNVTAENVKIPAGAKQEVLNEINVKVPGLGKSVPLDSKTSVVANIKPKVIPKVFKKKSS